MYNRNDDAISIKIDWIEFFSTSTQEVSVFQLRKDFLFYTLIFFFSYIET